VETIAAAIGVVAVAAIILYVGAGILSWLREEPGAEWTPSELDEAVCPPDPLTREISPIELAPAHLFDEVAAGRPIQIDWQPPTFSQTWRIAGERMADLGDTQQIERVEVSA
jgi:hypothetical protein